jgi:hypothetical protein
MEYLTDIPFFEEPLCDNRQQNCRYCESKNMQNSYCLDFCSEPCCYEFMYQDDDDDNSSCASDETMLSIYTYERRGKHKSKQLKDRIKVKTIEKYGYPYGE